MDIAEVWSRLNPAVRDWLIAHNGEPLPPEVTTEIARQNGDSQPSWVVDSPDGPVLADDAVDWIEAVANAE